MPLKLLAGLIGGRWAVFASSASLPTVVLVGALLTGMAGPASVAASSNGRAGAGWSGGWQQQQGVGRDGYPPQPSAVTMTPSVPPAHASATTSSGYGAYSPAAESAPWHRLVERPAAPQRAARVMPRWPAQTAPLAAQAAAPMTVGSTGAAAAWSGWPDGDGPGSPAGYPAIVPQAGQPASGYSATSASYRRYPPPLPESVANSIAGPGAGPSVDSGSYPGTNTAAPSASADFDLYAPIPEKPPSGMPDLH